MARPKDTKLGHFKILPKLWYYLTHGSQNTMSWVGNVKSSRRSKTKINFIVRGAAAKTELSLVDKIELARTYQPLTGKWMP